MASIQGHVINVIRNFIRSGSARDTSDQPIFMIDGFVFKVHVNIYDTTEQKTHSLRYENFVFLIGISPLQEPQKGPARPQEVIRPSISIYSYLNLKVVPALHRPGDAYRQPHAGIEYDGQFQVKVALLPTTEADTHLS